VDIISYMRGLFSSAYIYIYIYIYIYTFIYLFIYMYTLLTKIVLLLHNSDLQTQYENKAEPTKTHTAELTDL